MGRIGVTLSGIERSLLNRLAEANAEVTLSSMRLASGAMINSAADDPSGFVRLSGLQSQLNVVQSTMTNATAAASMVTQTQSAIDSIQTQLASIRTELLTDEDGALTTTQRAAAQATIDAAIQQINTLAGTQIDGRRVLDGSANFSTSGAISGQVRDVRVYSTGGAPLTIAAEVKTAATQASLTYTGNASDQITNTATFTLTGERGSAEITVTAGEDLTTSAATINAASHKTGVTAEVKVVDAGADQLVLTSVEYGSRQLASVNVTDSGPFIVNLGQTTTDYGTDVTAQINGHSYTGDGNRVAVNQDGVRFDIEFDPIYDGWAHPIDVSGDALTYSLSTDLARPSILSIPGLQPGRLGGDSGTLDQLATDGSLSGLSTNTSQAIRVVDEALAELTVIEGAVDGFYNASISSASTLLSDLETDLETAIDDVNLVNSTEEALVQAYYSDLASNAVSGLAILRQQRAGIVNLLQLAAGLI